MAPALVTLPATASLEEVYEVIRRDGGVIIKDFFSEAEIDALNAKSTPMFAEEMAKVKKQRLDEMGPNFHASNTTHLRGLLGRLPQEMSQVIKNPMWENINEEFLKGETKTYVGDHLLVTKTSFILSLCVGFRVAPGAGMQILHRDQSIHSVNHQEGSMATTDLGCLIAGTKSTAGNGATRVIPGSHLWGWDRIPTQEEAVSAEMEKGSAFFWLGSAYHGAGANTMTPGEENDVRVLYGIFACQDFLRAEEAQHLAVPESVARTLDKEVLARSGWKKGAGGCGFLNADHPMDYLKMGV